MKRPLRVATLVLKEEVRGNRITSYSGSRWLSATSANLSIATKKSRLEPSSSSINQPINYN